MQRRSQRERWADDASEMVGGVQWRTIEEGEDADGPCVKTQLGERMPDVEVERTAAAEVAPRRMNSTKADLEKYGFTAGCLGCRVWLAGRLRQGHSEEYRPKLKVAQGGQRKDSRGGEASGGAVVKPKRDPTYVAQGESKTQKKQPLSALRDAVGEQQGDAEKVRLQGLGWAVCPPGVRRDDLLDLCDEGSGQSREDSTRCSRGMSDLECPNVERPPTHVHGGEGERRALRGSESTSDGMSGTGRAW